MSAPASLEAQETQATQRRRRIEGDVRARYAAERASADICDSLEIEMRIRAEIRRQVGDTEPSEPSKPLAPAPPSEPA